MNSSFFTALTKPFVRSFTESCCKSYSKSSMLLERCVRSLLLVVVLGLLVACSTTTSNVRDVMKGIDRSELSYIKLAVTASEGIQTALQDSGRLYEMHSRSEEVLSVIQTVVRYYGFTLVEEAQADFVLDVQQALPDGGACVYGMEAARDNFTYTTSLVTLGVVPAKAAHCIVVSATLYEGYQDDATAIGEFISNLGWVRIYAGVGEIENYRKTVTERDEVRALEASAAGLLNLLIEEGAFK